MKLRKMTGDLVEHIMKVRIKSFQVNDLVWKIILPIGTKDNKFGKWSPSWEGPFQIVIVCS